MFLLAVLLTMAVMQAYAENVMQISPATKTNEVIDREKNLYRVKVNVPGLDGVGTHDEIILMLDASTSMNNWNVVCEGIRDMASKVLDGSGRTVITLMTFGISDRVVADHIASMDELNGIIENSRNDLLKGRSATNCEVGFTSIGDYIRDHRKFDYGSRLDQVFVIYISDSASNTSDEPLDWQNWMQHPERMLKGLSVEDYILEIWQIEKNRIARGLDILPCTKRVIRDTENASMEELSVWIHELWKDVMEENGLVYKRGNEYPAYPVSRMEKVFVDYAIRYNNAQTYQDFGTTDIDLVNALYYAIFGYTQSNSYIDHKNNKKYPGYANRAVVACRNLANLEKVEHIYLVGYNNAHQFWMNKDSGYSPVKGEIRVVNHPDVTFMNSNEMGGLGKTIRRIATDMIETPYNDVVITDYISKWVNLDPASLTIYDGNKRIYAKGKWLVNSGRRPTSREIPVKCELVKPKDYAPGGSDVTGNTSGNIYKLTWYVKDGPLLATDAYRLEYNVTVDTLEKGFVYSKDYPSNGRTYADYKDKDGRDRQYDIAVPDVIVKHILGNEETPDPNAELLPDTGDNSSLPALAMMLMTGLAGFVLLRRKKNRA